jgi:hypothetical protein
MLKYPATTRFTGQSSRALAAHAPTCQGVSMAMPTAISTTAGVFAGRYSRPTRGLRCEEAIRYEPSAGLHGCVVGREDQQAQNKRTDTEAVPSGATSRLARWPYMI